MIQENLSSQSLLATIELASSLAGQKIPRDRLDHVRQSLERVPLAAPATLAVVLAWNAAGLEGCPHVLPTPTQDDLPFIARFNQDWFVVVSRMGSGSWKIKTSNGALVELSNLEACECVAIPPKATASIAPPKAISLVWEAILHYRSVFFDAIIASAIINVLALTTSLYSMQVYDRVIPNHGFQTLWVLSLGVVISIFLEFFLKHVRTMTIEKTCKSIDGQLSEWFFQRALGIRMEGRPSGVGSLASQIKGFELVRGVMTSASLFVLVDIPFAVLFVLTIGMIGGVVVLVPLVALPIALMSGLVFQSAITRHAKSNLVQNHLKTGLLVESIDGAESLKAAGAEWKFLARWKKLVANVGESDYNLKQFSTISQNLTALMQQLGYVTLVGFGAYLAADNSMTMGGLIACSILIGRAMSAIAMLPTVMVQWAHAGAALDGLDKLIKLPNESDGRDTAMVPQKLDGSMRFERVSFVYGAANHLALEIPHLVIPAGERVGVLGAVGSGKSTLLKLASGLFCPIAGKVFIGQLDASLIAPAVLREKIGYLPQDFQLFSGTLRENLLLGLPDPGDEAILEAAKLTGVIELITGQAKGLALSIGEGGRGVSGGQKQLIGLTRLLLAKPQVWILDEPTSSMDAKTERRIVALLGYLATQGVTMLIATHKTSLLPIFNRLLFIKAGRLALEGPRENVLASLADAGRALPSSEPAG